jgi:Zn-dependent peptidase ImmA (M78 family)/transcriptional regulator with XRE-family HTH domain
MAGGRVVGRTLTLTREAKGWTQQLLAEATGVSQSFLSKVEHDQLQCDGEHLDTLAAALEVPPQLLTNEEPVRGLEVTCLHHRRRSSKMTASAVRRIEGLTHLTRISAQALINGIGRIPERQLGRLDVDTCGSPTLVARTLRSTWHIPDGPIVDVVGLLESLGIIVMRRDLHTAAQDAMSTWPPGQSPVILLNRGLPPDRERFTLIHELGHLIMHELPTDDQESQANQFAGEFLAPAGQITSELTGLTVRDFNRLAHLKIAWGVSMAALIQRAADLDCISANQFKTFRIRLNQYGWSRREPGDLKTENPSLIPNAIDIQLDKHGRSVDQLAASALMLPAPFRRHYLTHRGDTSRLSTIQESPTTGSEGVQS